MLLCGIATQALRKPELRLLKGERYGTASATWSLGGKQLFVACGLHVVYYN